MLEYKRVGFYHVAAFEIQSAWRVALQHWEMNLLTEEQILKQGQNQVAHARVFAANKIQQAWRKISNYRIYYALRDIVAQFRGTGDPFLLLRSILPRESMLLDPSMQVHLRFRLGGTRFPPSIYYKIFTHGAVCDLGAFAPRNYAAERLGAPRRPEDAYARIENNGWRPLIVRLQPGGDRTRKDEVEKATSRKVIKNFHHSRSRRRQDVERERKQRTIAWMRKIYTSASEEVPFPYSPSSVAAGAPSASGGAARMGRGSNRNLKSKMTPQPPPMPPPQGRPRPSLRTSNAIAMPAATSESQAEPFPQWQGEDMDDECLLEDLPDDMLLEWSKKLDFEAYMDSWAAIATSDCSEGTLPIGAQTRGLGTEAAAETFYSLRGAPHSMIARVH